MEKKITALFWKKDWKNFQQGVIDTLVAIRGEVEEDMRSYVRDFDEKVIRLEICEP